MSAVMSQTPSRQRPAGFDARRFVVRYGLFFLLIALVVAFSAMRPSFASAANITDMLRTASISAIMFLGLTWIIAAGEIDVSFMSVAALATMIVAGIVQAGGGWPVAAAAALAGGLVVGCLNGLLVAILRLPALVITIASGGLAGSIAAAIGKGTSIPLNSTGFVGEIVKANLGIVPVLAIAVAIVYAACLLLQDRTTFGHYIYAMEQNHKAVVEAGIPAGRLLFMLYVLSGVFSALAGVLLTADLASGQPYIGTSYFIDGLTAVLLGGMALKMGKPNVVGTLAGVMLLAVLLSGAALLGWTDSQRQIVRAGLLIAGVALVVWTRRKSKSHL